MSLFFDAYEVRQICMSCSSRLHIALWYNHLAQTWPATDIYVTRNG